MPKLTKRAFLVVLDGVGVGNAPDASVYGDEGSDTLGNLALHHHGLTLPNLEKVGLGTLHSIKGLKAVENPIASYGRLEERSAGKDSIAGHWEICGLTTSVPFPTFLDAFPLEVVDLVERISGKPVIGNEVASGTEIMDRLGEEHVRSGKLILYTSADSVLQLLAHEEVVPLQELYRVCETIRHELKPPYRVARVIARPFLGEPGSFKRTPNRKDYAVKPQRDTVLDVLVKNGIDVHGIGKVDTLFDGSGFTSAHKTKRNAQGIVETLERINSAPAGTLTFTNLLDFDMEWGHRNDVDGFKGGLEELDANIMSWLDALNEDDLMIITADHGNDPTTPSTDHSREHVPLMALFGGQKKGVNLGVRNGFADIAATIAAHFGVEWSGEGTSFYSQMTGK